MTGFLPALDHPHTFDHEDLAATLRFGHANGEVAFLGDRESDLHDLNWAWSGRDYARSVRIRLTTPHNDDFTPMAVRRFPGYQETILGTEGAVISKRLFAPLLSGHDSAVLWQMECQAEGDWLVQVDVEIDWGIPLTQRIVDGLLVAQENPTESRGVYGQQNADSTRVFGTTQGRPSHVDFPDEAHAHLVYIILVTGTVDVPFILALSDVGEQLAWNGFLALRESDDIFRRTNKEWRQLTHGARLWTPNLALNHGLEAGKIAALQQLRRLRTGLAPADRQLVQVLPLLDLLDAVQPTRSLDLLAHLSKVAQQTKGKLPELLPASPRQRSAGPGAQIAYTNSAYLYSLERHLGRHPNLDLLAEHYPSLRLCAENLVQARWRELREADSMALRWAAAGLRRAATLARIQDDSANAARWESEAVEYVRLSGLAKGHPQLAADSDPQNLVKPEPTDFLDRLFLPSQIWDLLQPDLAANLMDLAGQALWQGCGVTWSNGSLHLQPAWPGTWAWWALLDLPLADRQLSLLWDGETLHSTQPLHFAGPVVLWQGIQVRGDDPDAFALRFELTDKAGEQMIFTPTFS